MLDSIQPVSVVPDLTQAEWLTFKDLVYRATGIALSPAKKQLLVARLMRRLKALRLSTFTEYYNRIVEDLGGAELQTLVNSITTNKTEFFREPHHFELLRSWLESSEPAIRAARLRGLRIWCAASSTGEEPYTIAAVVRAALTQSEWERATIYATDVDTNALQTAKAGRYKVENVQNVDDYWLERLFTSSGVSRHDHYSVRPELMARVRFGQLNLAKGGWRIPTSLDAVFCRNVLIYFDKPTQLDVVRRACRLLAPHGLLFLGHSEGLVGFELRLEPVTHTAYRARGCSTPVGPSSLPQMHAVTLSDAAPSRRRPYVIGASGRLRLHLKIGAFVALFSTAVRQTCVAFIEQDCSNPQRAPFVEGLLDSMVNALKHVGATEGDVVGKVIALRSTCSDDQQQVQDIAREWLQRANIELVAMREVEAPTELRVEFNTGRIRISSAAYPREPAKPDGEPSARARKT